MPLAFINQLLQKAHHGSLLFLREGFGRAASWLVLEICIGCCARHVFPPLNLRLCDPIPLQPRKFLLAILPVNGGESPASDAEPPHIDIARFWREETWIDLKACQLPKISFSQKSDFSPFAQ